jgi:hypothetical protein
MATPKKPGSASEETGEGYVAVEPPPSDAKDTNAGKTRPRPRPPRLPDFDDSSVKKHWEKILDRQREQLDTDVLRITPPRSRLDPIAQEALDVLVARTIGRHQSDDARSGALLKKSAAGKSTSPEGLERAVRAYIVDKGIASEVKKVTDRLNARRMTDGRRWVLYATYVYLLAKLFDEEAGDIEDLIKDDLGVAEKLLLDLAADKGPLDTFANLIVRSVMERNRITRSDMLQGLVAQRLRSAI